MLSQISLDRIRGRKEFQECSDEVLARFVGMFKDNREELRSWRHKMDQCRLLQKDIGKLIRDAASEEERIDHRERLRDAKVWETFVKDRIYFCEVREQLGTAWAELS